MSSTFSLIIICVTLSAAGQLLLKVGMNKIGHFEFTAANVLPISIRVLTNIPVMGGISIYLISLVMWLMILSRTEVSFAYPLVSLGYIVNAIAAYYFLNENLSVTRLIGILVIIMGVALVSRS